MCECYSRGDVDGWCRVRVDVALVECEKFVSSSQERRGLRVVPSANLPKPRAQAKQRDHQRPASLPSLAGHHVHYIHCMRCIAFLSLPFVQSYQYRSCTAGNSQHLITLLQPETRLVPNAIHVSFEGDSPL